MPVESLSLNRFAETATDYAHDNVLHLHSQMLAPGLNGIPGTPIRPLDEFVQGIPTKDKVLLHDFKMGTVLQPDKREGFTPTADAIKIEPRWGQVVECKINLLFTEKKIVALQKSFFGMKNAGGAQAKLILDKFPFFESFFMDKIIEKAKAELRTISLWNGSRNIALQTPVAIFDGWSKKIDQAIVSTALPAGNIAACNVLTVLNTCDELTKIVDKIPSEQFYNPDLICLISPNQMKLHNASYQKTRGALPYNTTYQKQYIEGTNIEFLVEPGLARETPIITTRNNLAFLYDDDMQDFNIVIHFDVRSNDLAVIVKFQAQPEIIDYTEIFMGDTP